VPSAVRGEGRGRFDGTATIVRFNWPKYVVAFATVLILVAVLVAVLVSGVVRARDVPVAIDLLLVSLAVVTAVGVVTSLTATWWVYDHVQVYRHVPCALGDVGRWVSVHAGFDDATAELVAQLGTDPLTTIDLEVPARASLRRARGLRDPHGEVAAVGALPLRDASVDTVFVTLAVHELRDLDDQRRLFGELQRVLVPGGRVVVTEHLRDVANGLVYGPAALHFQRADTWRSRATEAAFVADREVRITPFVRRFVWTRGNSVPAPPLSSAAGA